MKLLMVYNLIPNNAKYSRDRMELLLKAQIDNSLQLGWDANSIVLVSNTNFNFMNVESIKAPLNDFCLTGSKMWGLLWYFINYKPTELIWSKDLDCWQNARFDEPEFAGDIGIARYSNSRYNGGSVFWKPESVDIIQQVVDALVLNEEIKEEPTLNKLLKSDGIKKRVTVIDNTFNVGCSGFVVRYNRSKKPIHVCHFHPDNRIAWETHTLDRNSINEIAVSVRLERLIRKYYPNLATKVVRK